MSKRVTSIVHVANMNLINRFIIRFEVLVGNAWRTGRFWRHIIHPPHANADANANAEKTNRPTGVFQPQR